MKERERERKKKKKRKDCTRSNKLIYQGCRIQLCFKILATKFENKIKKKIHLKYYENIKYIAINLTKNRT